jgi:hypothetical protein
MATEDAGMHLDGNAAGGWLSSLFCAEMTLAVVCCDGCGAAGPIGGLRQFGHDMGIILRCPACDTAVLRLSRVHDRYWLDLRGSTSLRVAVPAEEA